MAERKSTSDVPQVDLSSYTIDPDTVHIIPAAVAEKYKLIPLFKVGKTLTVAMAEPRNIVAIDEVRTLSKLDVSVVKSSLSDIRAAISEYYGISGIIDDVIKNYRRPSEGLKPKSIVPTEAPVVKLVDVIVAQAIRENASDIHIEPEAKQVRVRYRVDGILHEEVTLPSFMLSPIVSRIKVLAAMDIAESRIPQDGRFSLDIESKKIDFRVSTFPSAFGEKIVLRILDKASMFRPLRDIGLDGQTYDKYEKLIRKPHGIILVTGPTGSGKTSTLYATLAQLNSKQINIITVEDPIEYELSGITQSQVNVKAGLTFASALRSILRQDPDIILIGEIRDLETVNIAIQAAMTGHLVFSTLHTNDAPSSLTRLLDMKVEPFLIASSVEGILAQRLVRTICRKCKREIPPAKVLEGRFPELKVMYKGMGCKTCKGTGFRGRTGIYELLVLDEGLRKMVADKVGVDTIRKYAIEHGMQTLFENGLEKVSAGITTLDEVLRVTELEQV
ncbi:MAG: type II/IV secretion system protein [Candidatus Saganbacteria bacterium]|nr:type II/IV secretion system protein [Candidatus Saganbacteria bacterium]